jgi:hypothetical protein
VIAKKLLQRTKAEQQDGSGWAARVARPIQTPVVDADIQSENDKK